MTKMNIADIINVINSKELSDFYVRILALYSEKETIEKKSQDIMQRYNKISKYLINENSVGIELKHLPMPDGSFINDPQILTAPKSKHNDGFLITTKDFYPKNIDHIAEIQKDNYYTKSLCGTILNEEKVYTHIINNSTDAGKELFQILKDKYKSMNLEPVPIRTKYIMTGITTEEKNVFEILTEQPSFLIKPHEYGYTLAITNSEFIKGKLTSFNYRVFTKGLLKDHLMEKIFIYNHIDQINGFLDLYDKYKRPNIQRWGEFVNFAEDQARQYFLLNELE